MSTTATATACARYDCGHIARSSSRALKRAAFLYLAEVDGQGDLSGREPAEVLAALGMMREATPCETIAAHLTGTRTRVALPTPRPEVPTLRLTPQQAEVLALATEGYSIPEVATATGRAVETVRSLYAAARRATGTHSTVDAAVVASRYGLI